MKKITEYNVIPDSQKIQTKDIQRAIHECARLGQKLVFEKGIYRTGTLVLANNSHIELKTGAVILGSENPEDYICGESGFVDAVGRRRGEALILSYDIENITLEGEGEICGNGAVFTEDVRPFLVRIVKSRNVSLRGVRLTDAGAWCLHLTNSDNVDVRGISINSDVNCNNDGIDIDASRHVNIEDCHVVSGDDGICLKATTDNPCEYISVKNCKVSSGWGCFKIGTESVGDVRHVTVRDCVFYDNIGGGIKIVPTDGAEVEDVTIDGIEMKNCTGPIFINLGERLRRYAGIGRDTLSTIKDVTIRNIKADVVRAPERGLYMGQVWGNSIGGIVVSGTEKNPIQNIVLENIEAFLPGGEATYEEHEVPYIGENYPEFHMLDPLPAKGIYLRNIHGAKLKNIRLTFKEPDVREVMITEALEDLSVESLN